jgi:LysR family hydrogen peroxide-inducible transcriptional activator
MMTGDIIRALDRDMLDAAIMAGGTSPEGIREEELFNDRFFAYVSTDHPLCQRSNIRIEDIDVRHLLLLSEGNCLRDQVIELCQAQKNIARQYSFESGSLETLMRIVDNTPNLITIIPEMVADYIDEKHRPQVKTLAKGAASRKITIAVRRTYVKRSLIDALKESVMNVARN